VSAGHAGRGETGRSKKTGYVVNHPRQGRLVTQRSESVAFILSEPAERLFADPNFAVLLRGCTQALAEHGHRALRLHRRDPFRPDQDHPLPSSRRATSTARLLVSVHAGDPLLEPARDGSCPVRRLRGASRLRVEDPLRGRPTSGAAGRAMVEYLRSIGRTRGRHHPPGRWTPSAGRGRLEGYRDVVGAAFDESLVEEGDYGQDSGERGDDQAP